MNEYEHRALKEMKPSPRRYSFVDSSGMLLLVWVMFGLLPTMGLFALLQLEIAGNRMLFAVWALLGLLFVVVNLLWDLANRIHSDSKEQWSENLFLRSEIVRLEDEIKRVSESRNELSRKCRHLDYRLKKLIEQADKHEDSIKAMQRRVSAYRAEQRGG